MSGNRKISPKNTDFLKLPINKNDLFPVFRFDGREYVELLLNKEGLMSLLSVQGTQLLLQVNNVDNVIQSVLNLVQGTNITLTDNGDGSVTIDSTGGGSTITLQVNGVNNVIQNVLNLVDGLNTTVVDNGDGSVQIDVTTGGTGTVTSVDVSASGALADSGGPITTNGVITLSWTGNNTQFVRGDGTLSAILTALSQFTNDVGFITTTAANAAFVPIARTITNIGANFGNGQTVVLAGTVAYIRIPFDITVSTWSIFSSIAGSVVVDIWRLANAEPTVANTIIGGGTKPFLSSEKLRVSSPTGWTSTALLAGDILAFRVDSCSLITKFVIQLNPT